MTSATIAQRYKQILTNWAIKTDQENVGFVDFQGHDFSMRGMGGLQSALSSGMGHAASFKGSDSLPVIHGLRKYYNAQAFVVGSVNATEHSVMCAGTKDGEIETFRNLMKTYPTGILSVVSDTWDLWKVVGEYLPTLKDEITSRDGKIVIRPDSGDPVDIICGTKHQRGGQTIEEKGVVEALYETFGGHVNEQGYACLDQHIGVIYGDSITIERAQAICQRLAEKGFASTNVVLGIGSFTYQLNTRDTFGFAMKATSVVVNGQRRDIFKDPVTDDGVKKSARGLVYVGRDDAGYYLIDQVTEEKENSGELVLIYENGKFHNHTNLEEIRQRINQRQPKQLVL